MRYYKPNYPLLKKNPKKSKSNTMMTIWDDNDILSSHEKKEEGMANLCLIANDDEVNNENSFKFILDELFKGFNNLMDEYKKLRLKNKKL